MVATIVSSLPFSPWGEAAELTPFVERIGDAPVKKVNTFPFFSLGFRIGELGLLQPETPATSVQVQILGTISSIERFLADVGEPWGLSRSCRVLTEFRNLLTEVLGRTQETGSLSGLDCRWLGSRVAPLSQVLSGDLAELDIYYVSPKGIFLTDALITKANGVFVADVLAKMPEDAKEDFGLAGRCLAFEVPNASGFHAVRATETMIHTYYVAVTGITTLKRKDRNWGAYVRNLTNHRKQNTNSKADTSIIGLIEHIRVHHRNPVIHPEIRLDMSEAMELFNICQSAISTLARVT